MNVINQIKTVLGMEIKLEQMKLADGMTVIEAEIFEQGNDVFVISEDGEKVAAPDGEYPLEDGKVMVVAEGVIQSVSDAVQEEAAAEDVVAEEQELSVEPVKEAKKVVETTSKETHFSAEQITELEILLERMFAKHLEMAKEIEVVEEPVKEEMSKEIKHNPEKEVKSFKSIKSNVGYSTKQTILSKMSKINNK